MDFEYHYTEAQETFRKEVGSWLDENVPHSYKAPVDQEEMSDAHYNVAREMRRKLGKKGWLNPTYPKQYGGGGLSGEQEVILGEELRKRKVPLLFSNPWITSTLLVWGTEEQKQKFLVPLLMGELIAYQAFTEPQSGSDLANVKSTAVRDGDDWIINGQKLFVSGPGPDRCDILYGPLMTDPDSPRHRNLGYFIIPAKIPGVSLVPMKLTNGRGQHFVFYENARVTGDHLIGGDHQGWQVTQTSLEEEHGGRGRPLAPDDSLQDLVKYVQKTKHNDGRLGEDPFIQQNVVDDYIDSHVGGLLTSRNYSMFANREEMSYHGSQGASWGMVAGERSMTRGREVFGPYSLLGTKDARAVNGGSPEVRYGRRMVPHAGGSPEIQKVIIARRLGISRTPERAAPTPSTATEYTA